MNVDYSECQRVGLGTYSDMMNASEYHRIYELRQAGMGWADIHQRSLQYSDPLALRHRFNYLKGRLRDMTEEVVAAAKWTDVECKRAMEIGCRHVESTTRLELADIMQREFPGKPFDDVSAFANEFRNTLKFAVMRERQWIQMQGLVARHGKDWDVVGKAMNILPSRAQYNWIIYGPDGDEFFGSYIAEEAPVSPEATPTSPEAISPWQEANSPLPEASSASPEAYSSFLEANSPWPEADLASPEAKLPSPEADLALPDVTRALPEANLPSPEATPTSSEANSPSPETTLTSPDASPALPKTDTFASGKIGIVR
ncbi:hypothetical protein IWW38_003612 [Coemansia aciculifera]|uniref:Uncharacterized protein n=1 Tax=Coemansia aciculifera TaxID=417176 RepID=A0ACC1M0M6_9FUNG|nr:hypothetical protein IWW38_003612 [Coemansia aciculifera]